MTKTLIPFLVWEFDKQDAIIDNQPFFDKAAAHLKYHHTIADNTIQFLISKSGDIIIGIVGPADIAEWLYHKAFSSCPEEVFSDAATKIKLGDGKEIFDRVTNWFWHPEEELVYITSEKQSHPILYSEWLEPTAKKIDETDWVEKIPMVAVYKFCSGNKYGGNKPKEYIKENWQRFFKPIVDADWVAGMAEILKWEGDPNHEETILKFLTEKHLDKAIEYWA